MDLNLLQRDVAELVGVDKASIENWEQNRSNPTVRVSPRILEFLGYDPRSPATTIGAKLRRHRQSLGLNWAKAVEAMGVDPATVSKWERQPDERFDHRSIPIVSVYLGQNPLPPPGSASRCAAD